MAIPENKTRITITIHNETKNLVNELLALHDNLSASNLIEIALYCYASILNDKLEQQTKEKGDKKNAKN